MTITSRGYWKLVGNKIKYIKISGKYDEASPNSQDTVKAIASGEAITNVHGYWRRDPRTGKMTYVKDYQRHYIPGQQKIPGAPVSAPDNFPTMTVNFTAYREPGQEGIAHTGAETYDVLSTFVDELQNDDRIHVLSYAPTLGAWETGHEPSAVLKLAGDYKAIKEKLKMAGKKWVQDAIIISRPNPESNRKSYYFKINAPIDKGNRDKIKQILLANKIGGWTWLRGINGERYLNIIDFPEWGTNMTPEKAEKIKAALRYLKIDSSWTSYGIDLDILESPYGEEQ